MSWPRLNPPTDIINYDGPGFKAKRKGRGFGLIALSSDKSTTRLKQNMGKWAGKEIEMGTLTKKRVD